MKKIPCLFERDFTAGAPRLLPTVTKGCEWALVGEGVATRKFDGSACLIRYCELYVRYDAKGGKPRPPGFVPCGQPDPVTGHDPGWVPADRPSDKWAREAFERKGALRLDLGRHVVEDFAMNGATYEVCGPKVGGNPEGLDAHWLLRHGSYVYRDVPRTFDGLREWLRPLDIEGLVFWRDPTCVYFDDACKIRKADFGLPRRPEEAP